MCVEVLALEPLPAVPRALDVAHAHIVRDRVAEDVVERVALEDIAALPADHDRELHLVVELLGGRRGMAHRRLGTDDRERVLREERRVLGDLLRGRRGPELLALGEVLGVVPAHAEHVSLRHDRREEPDRGQRDRGRGRGPAGPPLDDVEHLDRVSERQHRVAVDDADPRPLALIERAELHRTGGAGFSSGHPA